LVSNHGPFIWADSINNVLNNSIMLEYIAKIQYKVQLLNVKDNKISKSLIDKHYYRKHGDESYYGQD